jgi:hypothetical protein
MSYAIVIAPDAYSQWRALDPMLQELTLCLFHNWAETGPWDFVRFKMGSEELPHVQ